MDRSNSKKTKTKTNCNPNIFSEIIELQENGGGGGNLTQIPYFQFYIEAQLIAHVAVGC